MNEDAAQVRWILIVGVRIIAAGGAVFGIILLARAPTLVPRILGIAIVLSALAVMAIVPAALAHRWRSPPEQ